MSEREDKKEYFWSKENLRNDSTNEPEGVTFVPTKFWETRHRDKTFTTAMLDFLIRGWIIESLLIIAFNDDRKVVVKSEIATFFTEYSFGCLLWNIR